MPEALISGAGPEESKPFVTSTAHRLCMPEPAVQRKPGPTTMEPSPLTAVALPPPRPTMPEPAVQRKACTPEELVPTTTEPSALTPATELFVLPGRWPRPTIPKPAVQRKAWLLEAEQLVPTMTEPSALTPPGML